MADDTAAPAANESAAPVAPASSSVADIASFLTERRKAPAQQTRETATPEPAGAAEEESQAGFDPQGDAGPEEAPGEYEEDDEAGEPPIEPPRAWSKAEKEAFKALSRDHQQAIADRERERDAHYQRGLQDAAARSKAAEAKEAAAEQARQQYEQALPSLLQQFQSQFAAEFHDVKTWDDVTNMQENDPLRFQRWQLAREKGQTLQREAAAAQHRQQQEQRANWEKFVETEDAAFLEKAPEFKDAKKAAELAGEANAMMADLGFSKEELGGLWNGGGGISLRDHRIQLALHKAVLYDRAQKALKAAKPKPVPPVQRPGAAGERAAVSDRHLSELTNKMKQTGSPRDIGAFLTARRKAKAS